MATPLLLSRHGELLILVACYGADAVPLTRTATDTDGDSYYAFRADREDVTVNTFNVGYDLNGDGDKDDILKVVTEKDLRHLLVIDRPLTSRSRALPIAASKGLNGFAAVSNPRVPLVGQLRIRVAMRCRSSWTIEIAKALPDDARGAILC